MKDKVNHNRKLFYYILTILGGVLLFVGIVVFIYDYVKVENSVYITAKIVSLDGRNAQANVKYTVNDKDYESAVRVSNGSDLGVGDTMMVRVSIKKPMEHIKRHVFVIFGIVVGGVVLVLLSFNKTKRYILRDKNIKYLKLSGIYILATITEVFVNANGKKYKDVFPYKLRCKYMNPMDNTVYSFDSEDTFVNIGDVLNKYGTKWVVVYIDRTNPSNYYVDLETLVPHVNLIDPIEFMKSKPVDGSETSDGESQDSSEENDEKKDTQGESHENTSGNAQDNK